MHRARLSRSVESGVANKMYKGWAQEGTWNRRTRENLLSVNRDAVCDGIYKRGKPFCEFNLLGIHSSSSDGPNLESSKGSNSVSSARESRRVSEDAECVCIA